MKIGDYVVHENSGIGRYTGIEQISVNGIKKDYLKIIYQGGDNLYLRGVELRLIADSDLEDLELSEVQPHSEDKFTIERQPMIRGKVLHLDGDEKYLNMCERKYKELKI